MLCLLFLCGQQYHISIKRAVVFVSINAGECRELHTRERKFIELHLLSLTDGIHELWFDVKVTMSGNRWESEARRVVLWVTNWTTGVVVYVEEKM